jgi:DNA replication licensing factor MCM5
MNEVAIEPEKLKKYIAFVRARCKPRLSAEAAELLKNRYVSMRDTMREEKKKNNNASAIPITVRQLEAIVRISESLARMEMSDVANATHVKEALRLFRVSTFSAATASHGDGIGSPEFQTNVQKAERYIEKRLPIGSQTATSKLIATMTTRTFNFGQNAVLKAIDNMVARDKLRYKRQRKLVERVRA